jgi:hypothetical protein
MNLSICVPMENESSAFLQAPMGVLESERLKSRFGEIYHAMTVTGNTWSQIRGTGNENHIMTITADCRLAADRISRRLRIWITSHRYADGARSAARAHAEARVAHEYVFETARRKIIVRSQIRGN